MGDGVHDLDWLVASVGRAHVPGHGHTAGKLESPLLIGIRKPRPDELLDEASQLHPRRRSSACTPSGIWTGHRRRPVAVASTTTPSRAVLGVAWRWRQFRRGHRNRAAAVSDQPGLRRILWWPIEQGGEVLQAWRELSQSGLPLRLSKCAKQARPCVACAAPARCRGQPLPPRT